MIPAGSNLFQLQAVDVTKPITGDRLERFNPVTMAVIGRFEIIGEPRLDSFATLWICEAQPVGF